LYPEYYNSRLSKRKKFKSLREVIMDIVKQSDQTLTLKEILAESKLYFLPFEPTMNSVNSLLQKLARHNIIEFVYLDLSYGVRLVNQEEPDFSIVN
jgi:hypothetical protein